LFCSVCLPTVVVAAEDGHPVVDGITVEAEVVGVAVEAEADSPVEAEVSAVVVVAEAGSQIPLIPSIPVNEGLLLRVFITSIWP
jgi:hypothetical protein